MLQCEKAKFFVHLKKKKQLIEEVETTNSDDCYFLGSISGEEN